ncbi:MULTISPECIES: Maf family nucleotide pyrophosphatase [unclassified Novosphingobium]|uniref:Maf family nucleotide pyrophosphatase n=1 Tax=unclassified Novosphingobium TaxID=2644732 RepID=UPI000ECEBA95|nr:MULTISPECIES: Maf family nucleotide pyrophosphatase [unclassified Novosphingobium]HCF25172.1 septum formation protein Maf [Novosphingobium sp.]HQV02417.1 Maf family nucleotide pyrophosphatase [Novosphingobium sp.]
MSLILASQSASRRAMLDAAGVTYRAVPAHLDERALEAGLGDASPGQVAVELAAAKALAVARDHPGALVLGSDSLVEVDGRRFDKPESRDQAADHLRTFSGQEMRLYSAAALARDGAVLWRHATLARLTVRELSDAFIEDYLSHEWPAVSGCVGVFRIEARGVQLFEAIEGDHFTVLGMPLLDVLGALREAGELPA